MSLACRFAAAVDWSCVRKRARRDGRSVATLLVIGLASGCSSLGTAYRFAADPNWSMREAVEITFSQKVKVGEVLSADALAYVQEAYGLDAAEIDARINIILVPAEALGARNSDVSEWAKGAFVTPACTAHDLFGVGRNERKQIFAGNKEAAILLPDDLSRLGREFVSIHELSHMDDWTRGEYRSTRQLRALKKQPYTERPCEIKAAWHGARYGQYHYGDRLPAADNPARTAADFPPAFRKYSEEIAGPYWANARYGVIEYFFQNWEDAKQDPWCPRGMEKGPPPVDRPGGFQRSLNRVK